VMEEAGGDGAEGDAEEAPYIVSEQL
jgi:hypothetical protein